MQTRSLLDYRRSTRINGDSGWEANVRTSQGIGRNWCRFGVKDAIAQALSRHKKLGESIAVWQEGKVVTLKGDEIPDSNLDSLMELESEPSKTSSIES
jgi:hypothetical protein